MARHGRSFPIRPHILPTAVAGGNTTQNQTISGLARIQVTTVQTISGKARIQVAVSQTITGKARVQQIVNQTITGKARITASVSQTILGKARIQATTSQTVTGKARIQKSVSQTITGKARITAATNQTISGKARITATTPQTIAGKARIQATTNQTITGKANITNNVTTTQTITGKARITAPATKTIAGKALITTTELLDQRQANGGTAAGFGQIAGVVYRGQGFIPTGNVLTSIAFKLNSVGSLGLKVYIDTADANSFPIHAVGSELYSFTITNANLATAFKKYALPVPLSVTPGTRYIMYFAPWDIAGNVYSDDYRDIDWSLGNPYANGKGSQFSGGSWSNSDAGNLDLNFDTYSQIPVAQTISGKARIQATTIQTIAGKARIQVTTVQTITGKASITTGGVTATNYETGSIMAAKRMRRGLGW